MRSKLLIFTMIVSLMWACEDTSYFPDPTLEIQFEHWASTDCCRTSVPFSNQDSIYLLQLDSVILVTFVEKFLTNPELMGGDSKTPNDFVYAFEMTTNHGDREVFVSDKNVYSPGSSSGASEQNGTWFSKVERSFVIPLSFTSAPVQDNSTIEIDPESNVTLSVSFSSLFSDLSTEQGIVIQQ